MIEKLKKLKKQLLILSLAVPLGIGSVEIPSLYKNAVIRKETEMYDDTIDDLKKLFIENGIDEPDEIFENFNYILWNGYLSKDKHFEYGEECEPLSEKYSGSACLSGEAVCRHMANMLKDLYEAYGYDSCTLICYLKDPGENIDKVFIGNHLITGVIKNNNVYYYDPTNKTNLYKYDENNLLSTYGNNDISLCYPLSLIFGNINMNDLNTIMEDERYVEPKSIYSDLSIDDLNEFYDKHKDMYNKISNKSQNVINDYDLYEKFIIITLLTLIANGGILYGINKKEKKLLKK